MRWQRWILPSDNIVHIHTNVSVAGCEGFVCVSLQPKQIKNVCTAIEDNHPLGRLFDMDVIDVNGEKISRTDLRGCLVCGKAGRECAAGRLHSVQELQTVTNKIINNYFFYPKIKITINVVFRR